MREKADLLDKIQEHEVVILRLSSETETIGKCMVAASSHGSFKGGEGGGRPPDKISPISPPLKLQQYE